MCEDEPKAMWFSFTVRLDGDFSWRDGPEPNGPTSSRSSEQYPPARRFQDFVAKREIEHDGTCPTGLRVLVLALCDYMVGLTGVSGDRQIEPQMESAMIGVLRATFLTGMREHGRPDGISPEIAASAASWATYGAVKEWVLGPDREPNDTIAGAVAGLVTPILQVRTGSAQDSDQQCPSGSAQNASQRPLVN